MIELALSLSRYHPMYFVVCLCVVALTVMQVSRYVFLTCNRVIRARNISKHGWPTPPLDADGDVVHEDYDL
jgi:hypothetical protein